MNRQRTYLPEQHWFRTGHQGEQQHLDAGSVQQTKFGCVTDSEQLNKETESALAEFDRQVEQFDDVYDNLGLVVEDCDGARRVHEDEIVMSSMSSTSLCLDTSSLCMDSLEKVRYYNLLSSCLLFSKNPQNLSVKGNRWCVLSSMLSLSPL